jgi:RND family efflux transporter MFP subunit
MNLSLKHALLVFGGVVVFVGAGTVVLHRVHADVPASQRPASTPVVRAAIAIVKRKDVSNSLSAAGEFLPYQEVELHAKVAGYIRRINVDIGDRVKEGEVLATLEVPELNAQVMGADAGVRHSKEEITRARNEVRRAEADHAALHAAAIRLKQAAAARPGLIAQQELDDAMAKDRAAEAQVDASKAALAAAQQQLEISKATHSQVTAMQDYSRIIAPFDGVVTWRYADTGALIQAGTSNDNSMPVVKLAQINVLRLRVPVPEADEPSIRIGAPVDVHIQATGEHFQGKITRFTDSFDRSTRTEQVEIDVPNTNYKLVPGMYADVSLQVQDHPNALTVPVQAVALGSDGGRSVLVLDSQNRVQPRLIRTGIEDPNNIEVLSGLKEGDRVIVGNLNAFRAGELIEPQVSKIAEASLVDGGAQ